MDKRPITLLVEFWVIHIYAEGVSYALLMALRIICLIVATFVLLTYTTSPVALTDALERLLHPLAKLKLPVHEFSMMMSIALRFIPTLLEETDKIMAAQKARGANFETGKLMNRIKALVPIWFRYSFPLSAVPTSLPVPWNAVYIMAARAERA